eukprot:2759082-Pyramimonas_sp.AAC.1
MQQTKVCHSREPHTASTLVEHGISSLPPCDWLSCATSLLSAPALSDPHATPVIPLAYAFRATTYRWPSFNAFVSLR